MSNYTYLSCSLDQWKKLVLKQYPTAKFHAAPENEGGTRSAYVADKFVGDWDGGDEPQGRIWRYKTIRNRTILT